MHGEEKKEEDGPDAWARVDNSREREEAAGAGLAGWAAEKDGPGGGKKGKRSVIKKFGPKRIFEFCSF